MHRKWRMSLAACLLALLIGGCNISVFPGDDYVESVMDYYYRGDCEEYQTFTGEDKSNVQAVYEEGIHAQAQAYLAYFGLEAVSEEAMDRLEDFVKMVYEYASYEITDAVLEEKEQKITVRIRPVAFGRLAMKETETYREQFTQKTEDGEYLYKDEEAYQSEYLEGLLNVYEKHLDDISYLEEQDFTVILRKSGSEYIPQDDCFEKIDAAVISFGDDTGQADISNLHAVSAYNIAFKDIKNDYIMFKSAADWKQLPT